MAEIGGRERGIGRRRAVRRNLTARAVVLGWQGGVWRTAVVAALVLLILPLSLTGRAFAQEEQPPIVPVIDEAPVAVIEGEPVDAVEAVAEPVTVPIEEPVVVPEVAEPAVPVAEEAPPPLAAAAAPAVDWAPPRTVYIPETGQAIDGVFLDVWRGWGGANAFGYPITPEFEENGRIVQYYGYGRFEYWPEDPNGNVVQFGALGAEMRPHVLRRGVPGNSEAATDAARIARAWLPLDPNEVEPDGPEWLFVPETGHGVAGSIKAYWEAIGGETYIGNPLTEEYELGSVSYQVFERGMVALEPGGSPYLMPVGELIAVRYGIDTSPVAQGNLPIYSEELFVPPPDPTPAAVASSMVEPDPNAERWIQVSLSQQYLVAWQGDVPVWEGYISTGREGFETPPGSYRILSKLESQTMEGVLGGEYYNVPDVPDVMYFTDRGHALHGTYWHANFGAPMSHGCVNLPMDAADWMYGWAEVGTRVEIVP